MKYTEVCYIDGNVIHGAIYWGIISDEEAKKKFKEEFPEHANLNLFTKVHKN